MGRVMLVGLKKEEIKNLGKIYGSVHLSCEAVSGVEAACDRINVDPPSLVVAGFPGHADHLHNLHAALQSKAPLTNLIVVLDEHRSDWAMESMRAGAYDCVVKPFQRLDILAASKRAAMRKRINLFVEKVNKRRKAPWKLIQILTLLLFSGFFVNKILQGPPPFEISLGSAYLSGLQWDGRDLWVGDWYDSTVTQYSARKGFFRGHRELDIEHIYRVRDGHPILIVNTGDTLISIGSDLKIRSHYRSPQLPTLETAPVPGTNPSGLAWDGKNLWSVDADTNLLYRHAGDLRVIDVVKSIIPHPRGLAWDGKSLWVLGDMPLRVAQMEPYANGMVWRGPYPVRNVLEEGVRPSGLAVGWGRLWFISEGDPRMVSLPIGKLKRDPLFLGGSDG